MVKYVALGQAFNMNFDVLMEAFRLLQKHVTFQQSFVSTSPTLGSKLNF